MQINLEQCLASAVRYIQDHADPQAKKYFDDLPESFMVPAIYFLAPRTVSRKATLQSYLTEIYMEAWFIAGTNWQAYADAANVRDCIILDDCAMSILENDGSQSGKYIRVDNIEIKQIDTGAVRLSFKLKNYFQKANHDVKIEKINISMYSKQSALYKAWVNVTKEQRKEEEENKKCLEKAMTEL